MQRNVYEEFLQVQENIKQLEMRKKQIESDIYEANKGMIGDTFTGTVNCSTVDYDVRIVLKQNVTVNQEMAAQIGGKVFRIKYELDKKEFDSLDPEDKGLVEGALTYKPAKPYFQIGRREE